MTDYNTIARELAAANDDRAALREQIGELNAACVALQLVAVEAGVPEEVTDRLYTCARPIGYAVVLDPEHPHRIAFSGKVFDDLGEACDRCADGVVVALVQVTA